MQARRHHARESCALARQWLERLSPTDREALALRDLGLMFCDVILKGSSGLVVVVEKPVRLPGPSTLVRMRRDRLLALLRDLSLRDSGTWQASEPDRRLWARYLGGLALSYGQAMDPVV